MGLFSDIFDKLLGFNPPSPPPPPPPPPPEPEKIDIEEEDEIRKRRLARLRGRSKTIVTGDLSPESPGKVGLLGRTTSVLRNSK
jgi:hypothetical protein